MSIVQFGEFVSTLTFRMMKFMLHAAGAANGSKAPGGLPAGAVYVEHARVILATTCCAPPLFHLEMHKAAAATGADVVLMRTGLEVEESHVTTFDVVIHVNFQPCLVRDLVLYQEVVDGTYWLVPSRDNGAHIAIEHDGLRLADEPPFLTWSERSDAVRLAAKQLKLAARPAGGR